MDLSDEQIAGWFSSNYFPKEIGDQLNGVRDVKKNSAQISTQIYEKENEIRESQDHQERLRKSIAVLGAQSSELKKYVQELGREEDKLNQLYASIKSDRIKKKNLDQEALKTALNIKHAETLISNAVTN